MVDGSLIGLMPVIVVNQQICVGETGLAHSSGLHNRSENSGMERHEGENYCILELLTSLTELWFKKKNKQEILL